jgi:2-keto-3-deoxy-L-rhamnonate aldolase RhmA
MNNYGESFCLTLPTNDPVLAVIAESAGINRICIDIERLGKRERQPEDSARISDHSIADIAVIKKELLNTELIVRINPINKFSGIEIDAVIDSGADLVMLPFFREVNEVEQFIKLINKRARCVLLLETSNAIVHLTDITKINEVEEIMVGLNDLHKELRLNNHFELLTSSLMDFIGSEIKKNNIAFSFGGVGRVDDNSLPIPSNLILAQYPLQGAFGAWISRSFINGIDPKKDLIGSIQKLRNHLSTLSKTPDLYQGESKEKIKYLCNCLNLDSR